jgi:hypothetical protein
MRVADIILDQLGGNKFLAMTGAHHLLADGNTLRMQLTKNMSKANRLWITLDADDTYTMHFFYYRAGGMKVDYKKGTVTEKPEIMKEADPYQYKAFEILKPFLEARNKKDRTIYRVYGQEQ